MQTLAAVGGFAWGGRVMLMRLYHYEVTSLLHELPGQCAVSTWATVWEFPDE
ncbi:hypothetical protein SAMD00023353_2800550 [Rosellinia necatrix]|uniref:Uncharacterized protein n=1 Tax=Rosellinia necatrix TaxID=77044 RepID=A0A1S8A8F7_ROSNE|nr:hypothetical protein SAMD00023353_2800550 [Rosellinia necatrix]